MEKAGLSPVYISGRSVEEQLALDVVLFLGSLLLSDGTGVCQYNTVFFLFVCLFILPCSWSVFWSQALWCLQLSSFGFRLLCVLKVCCAPIKILVLFFYFLVVSKVSMVFLRGLQ